MKQSRSLKASALPSLPFSSLYKRFPEQLAWSSQMMKDKDLERDPGSEERVRPRHLSGRSIGAAQLRGSGGTGCALPATNTWSTCQVRVVVVLWLVPLQWHLRT